MPMVLMLMLKHELCQEVLRLILLYSTGVLWLLMFAASCIVRHSWLTCNFFIPGISMLAGKAKDAAFAEKARLLQCFSQVI